MSSCQPCLPCPPCEEEKVFHAPPYPNMCFGWSGPAVVSGNTATGTINGVNYTYTSSSPVETTPTLFHHVGFPPSYEIPNAVSIKNVEATVNTLSFGSPLQNPVLVFASIGGRNPIFTSVSVNFGGPVEVLWSFDVTIDSPTRITGTEGYAIVKFPGTYDSVSFQYLTAETYCNFVFGGSYKCGA